MATKFLTGIDANSQRIQAVADPSTATDAANKQYVDNSLAGLKWKAPVRVATTVTGTLASAYANGQSVDGISLVTGDRILLKDQSTQTENGIYTVNASGAPTRALDADSSAELLNATVFVVQGTANADKAYTQTTNVAGGTGPVIGSDNIVFAQFGGGTAYTADGQGIELSSTTFSIELDGTTLSKSASGLRVGSGAAGNGLTESTGVLAVNTGTGLEINADAVRLATQGTGIAGGGGSTLSIDTAVVARRYSTTMGNASNTSFTINHAFNRREVQVYIYETATPFNQVFADVVHTDVNNVTITFATAPSSAQYTAVVVG
jgi:hypothetical protein